MALPDSCPEKKKFSKKQEEEGEGTPTNQFYKIDAPTSPPLEALLEREVGEEEVKITGHHYKLEIPSPSTVPTPTPKDQEGKGSL